MNNIVKVDPVILYSPHNDRPFSIDISFKPSPDPKPVVIHVHGFKGFKDWGYFNLSAGYFAEAGFIFVKINFSHNGVTPGSPMDFVDLEAFGRNNFSIEQADLGKVIDFVFSEEFPVSGHEVNLDQLCLTGHSRGGAAVILKGFFDDRVKAVASWAGVNDLANYFSESELKQWRKNGVTYVLNTRTGQRMPLYYQVVEDYLANEGSLDVPGIIKKYTKPLLIVHGLKDETVPSQVAYLTKKWYPPAQLFLVEGADHVFGGTHPWENDHLPDDARKVMDRTIDFFRGLSDKE
ncbi:MAG: prolyl oligopeptidase family serine peptidase [Cyclobacteriaceae bacterium]|nr:prolyl oligopeptidase family serine peptidase [Cyclobacteriaceae bacterium]